MPWHIVDDSSQCPDSEPYAVVLDETGEVVSGGCHETREEAQAHMDALYANEDKGDGIMGAVKQKLVKSVAFKDVGKGEIEAVFATLGVVDHDGDVLTKDAFDDGAPVVISAYGHTSHRGELPLGYGNMVITEDEAKMAGRFLMDTPHGAAAFTTIKALSEAGLQEWSFSLRNVESHREKVDGQMANVITHVDVKEVSPVLEGAGINTRTIVAKAVKESAQQLQVMLTNAARTRWGDDETSVWLEDWDPDDGKAIFCVWENDAAERLIQVTFERDGNDLTLGDEETEVARVTQYVPKARTPAGPSSAAEPIAELLNITMSLEGDE